MYCRPSNITTQKGAYMDFNSLYRSLSGLDRSLASLTRALKKEKRQKKSKEIVETLLLIAESMRKKGASEASIRTAVKGIYEYLKVMLGERLEKSSENIIKNPELLFEHDTEAPGILLSQVETQQVDWLWQRRIPLGKITILDGDPGLGKSLLAINIAACITTGRSMPDGTPGRQGSVILIAPEDGAEDTIKPRMEAAGGDPSRVLLLDAVEDLDLLDLKKVDVR